MANHYQNIIVAVDGSKEAKYAFRKSLDVSKRNPGSKIYLVHIVDIRSYSQFQVMDSLSVETTIEQVEALLKEYKEEAKAEGVDNIEIIVECGAPKTMITRQIAPKVNADLILCGATGLNVVERLIIGSVSEAIVRTASCDVLIIRTPE